MATLKQLLDNGLKVGALVRIFETVFQYAGGKDFYVLKSISNFMQRGIGSTMSSEDIDYLYNAYGVKLTTAYDCVIDANELPIPEPVDVTGWVVYTDWGYQNGYKFEPISFDYKMAEDGYHEVYEWKDCRACLPPR